MDKKSLRDNVRGTLSTLPKEIFNQQCQLIAQKLFQREEWKKANTVALTISSELEVHTLNIIQQAWIEGKQVAVPKCNPMDKSMSFRYIENFNQLEIVYFNIQEPIIEETREADKATFDLMIVPGIVFDPKGYRIGFGGGYYDRFLNGYKGFTISLLLSEQMYHKIPHNEYDIPVHMLILPNGVIETNG